MYLRQSNKWNDFLIQEAIEQSGLPLEIVAMIRDANSTDGPIPEKALTSLGTMVRSYSYATPLIIDWMNPSDDDNKFRSNPAISDLQAILYDRRKPRSERTAADEALRKEMDKDFIHPLVAGTTGNNPDNPRLVNILDTNRYRKRYVKKLKKAGLTEKAEASDKVFVDAMVKWAEKFVMPQLEPIIKAVVEDPDDYQSILKFVSLIPDKRKLIAAAIKAKRLLAREPEEPQNVVHKFDNGYYWYDIKSDACNIEGLKMGHCGQGMKEGNLYSLRSPSGTRKDPDPHVTIEMDADKTVWQVKGRGNMTPKKKYWPYISWFLVNMGAKNYREDRSGDASKEMIEYLEKASPDIFRQSFIEYAQETGDDWEEATKALLELDNISKNTMTVSAPFDLAGTTLDYDYLRVDYKLLYQADLPDEYQARTPTGTRVSRRERLKLFRNLKDSLESNFIAKHFSSEIFGVTPKVRVYPVLIEDEIRMDPWGSDRPNAIQTTLTWYFRFEAPPVSADQATQEEAKKAFAVTIKNANKLVNRLIDVEKGYYEYAADEQPSALEGFDLEGFEMDLQNFYDSKGLAKKEPKKRFDDRRVTERWSRIIK